VERKRIFAFLLLMSAFYLPAVLGPALRAEPQGLPPAEVGQFPGERGRAPGEQEIRMQHEHERAVNKERQQNLKRDTDKLLQLATELKQSVDKSNENTLSLDVIKKAEEIEKLAKSVREKMKGS